MVAGVVAVVIRCAWSIMQGELANLLFENLAGRGRPEFMYEQP